MSANPQPPPEELEEYPHDTDDSSDDSVEQVIHAFIEAFPEPTEPQVEILERILALGTGGLNARVADMFSDLEPEDLDDLTDLEGDALELDTELDDNDDLTGDEVDVFLVVCLMYNPTPDEAQVQDLADLVGLTPIELQNRIYRMITEELQDDVDDDGEDDDEDYEDASDDE